MEVAIPKTWSLPAWHSDWRDGERELEALREFSEQILREFPCATVALECIEEGYIRVNLFCSGMKVGEFFANIDERQVTYPLYLVADDSEKEYQVQSIDDGILVLRRYF